MKKSTSFVCESCGYDSPAFMGKCPECGTWNSMREIRIPTYTSKTSSNRQNSNVTAENLIPKTLAEINFKETDRFSTSFSEFDGVLGGGIVPGSVVLLAGDPGIGKSTLLLQLALNVASRGLGVGNSKSKKQDSEVISQNLGVLYISGEESEQQIKLRADRLTSIKNDNLLLLSLSNTDAIVEVIAKIKPKLVIIDSIQTMESENLTGLSGSVSQVRYSAMQFIKLAKSLNIAVIIVGHVTKEGMVAGPMVLSHMVDTVLFLEGEKFTEVRILRSLKNRFGPVDEVGIFSMTGEGMSIVKNPEQIFLSENKNVAPGSVLTATLEGTRAFLVEIQALAVYSKFPMPRRVAAGTDARRLELLLAVLQKHCKLPIENMDIYVNVAGGMRLIDPASDLAICLAVFSSIKNVTLATAVCIAEVGLLGELRPASNFTKRAKEAKKLGFSNILGTDKYKTLIEVIEKLSNSK
jgi:DNA repair protein RadA/Sms